MDSNIIKIIDVLKKQEYHGAGDFTEIAKGKNQIAFTWRQLKTKVNRIIKS